MDRAPRKQVDATQRPSFGAVRLGFAHPSVGRTAVALAGWMISCALVLPPVAQAACNQWSVAGTYVFHQSNGFSPSFDFKQPGSAIRGTGRYTQSGRVVNGKINSGGISPDSLSFGVTWRNGASGRYEGTINAATGLMSGYTEDKHGAGSPTASWWSDRPAKCLDVAAKPAAPKPPAPKAPPRLGDAPKHPIDPGAGVAKTLAGIWDTQTGDGVSYTLTLDPQGNGSVGAVDPKLSGTLQGTLGADGKSMSFVLTQAGAGVTSRGNLSLSGSGDTVSGRITKDTDGVGRAWTGTRRK